MLTLDALHSAQSILHHLRCKIREYVTHIICCNSPQHAEMQYCTEYVA